MINEINLRKKINNERHHRESKAVNETIVISFFHLAMNVYRKDVDRSK